MEPNTQEIKPEIEKVKDARLEQFSGSEQATNESSEITNPDTVEGVAESAQNEAVGEQAEAVEDFNEEATAQSVGDILKQGDNAIVETLPTEEEKRAAINAAIFSDIGPWRANNIATGSVDSETE
jgi:hypothetical protein